MFKSLNVHTIYYPENNNWKNREEGTLKILSTHENKKEAVKKGREFAIKNSSVHMVHSMDGSIIARNDYGNSYSSALGCKL